MSTERPKSGSRADRNGAINRPPRSLIDAFCEGRTPGRAMRIQSELGRLTRLGVDIDLERLETLSPDRVRRAVEQLRGRYAKQTAQATLKAFRAYVRFCKETQAIAAETAEVLQDAAGGHVLNKDRAQSHTALFPQLIQECERFPEPRRTRDSALVALWAGTDLTWDRLASLRLDEVEALVFSDGRLTRWIHRWLKMRGSAPGPLLCKIEGHTVLPAKANRKESLRGLVNQRLERVAPELSRADARAEGRASFQRWSRV